MILLLLISLFSGLQFDLLAQVSDSQTLDTLLSTIKKTDRQMKQLNDESFTQSKENYEFNVLLNKQNYSLSLLNEQIQKANTVLKEGIDYKDFTTELDLLVKLKKNATRGIVMDKIKMKSARDLSATSLLLKEILKRTNSQLDKISLNNESLSRIQRRMDSLAADKILYEIPVKEEAKKNYVQQMVFISNDLKLVNSSLKNAIDSIQKLEVEGKIFKYSLEADLALVNNARKILSKSINNGEPDIFYSKSENITFKQTLKQSFYKGYLSFIFYGANQINNLIVLLFFTFLTIYLRLIRKKFKKAKLYKNLKFPGYVLNHPLAAAILIMISIFQFFMPSPPFVFSGLFWLISGIAITLISFRSINRYWFKVWLIIFVLNIVAILDNLILLYTPLERNIVLLMSVIGVVLAVYILVNTRKKKSNSMKKVF